MNLDFTEVLRSDELTQVLRIISSLKSRFPGQALKILEIGAGAGWQARRLSEAGYSVEAIDIAQSEYYGARVWPVRQYDGAHIPFPDQYFDVVYSSNVLEHIPHLSEFQEEMQRVLRPNGFALHVVPSATWRIWTNLTHYPNVLRKLLNLLHNRTDPQRNPERSRAVADVTVRAPRPPKMTLFLNTIRPSRHGERGTALSEVYYFSRHAWSKAFTDAGWKLDRISSSRLFYTGYTIFGAAIPVAVRKRLSRFFGSSCHIFVVSPVTRTAS